jgi:hypothetical protein
MLKRSFRGFEIWPPLSGFIDRADLFRCWRFQALVRDGAVKRSARDKAAGACQHARGHRGQVGEELEAVFRIAGIGAKRDYQGRGGVVLPCAHALSISEIRGGDDSQSENRTKACPTCLQRRFAG